MKSHKLAKKLFAVVTSILMLVQPILPAFPLFVTSQVFAQEATPTETQTPTPEPTQQTSLTQEATATPTEEISPTPTQEVTPSPTVEVTPSITPEAAPSPEPTEEVTPTPSEESSQPQQSSDEPPKETGPPAEQGQILDGASIEATPTVTVEEGELQAIILQNVEAQSLDLDNVDPSNSATLTTDKADYAPTDTAVITGTGFTPGETYKLTISSDDPPPTSTTVDITADENGAFVYAYQLDGIYRPNYKAEAKDLQGNSIAIITFTDADSGFHVPSAYSNSGWTNPQNAYASDNARAVADSSSDVVEYQNFGFSIPGGSTINGIEVQVEGYNTGSRQADITLSWNNGASHTTGAGLKTTNMPGTSSSSEAVRTFGGAADTWNRTWSATDFTNSNFRLQLDATSGSGSDLYIDQVRVKVYYTEASLPDLTVTKTNNVSGSATINTPFNWVLTITNGGTATGTFSNTNTVLTDQLPTSNATYGTVTRVNGGGTSGTTNCSISSNTLTCTASGTVTIPVGGTITVTVPVTPTATGSLSNPRSNGNCSVDPSTHVSESNESNNACATNTVTVTNVQPAQNPSLVESCGIDVALVIDNSASISTGELTSMKTAFTGFVNTFLPSTPTMFSLTRFNSTATVTQAFTASAATINGAINGVTTSFGYTNWEDGLLKAQSTFDPRVSKPNLIIFASDGDPTASSAGPFDISQPNVHLNPAIVQANAIKALGTRIITLGIGSSPTAANLQAISSADAYYSTSNFDDLETTLHRLATDLCGGTITVTKLIDGDGNLQTTNDQTPASGWQFSVAGVDRTTGQNGQTDPVTVSGEGSYTVTETPQQGYSLISANCTGASGSNGNRDGNGIFGIQLSNTDIVSCTFINSSGGSISGHKYTESQIPVPGWGVTLYECFGSWTPENCTSVVGSTTTDSNGYYEFTNLTGQMYRLIEELRSGWSVLWPPSGIMDVNLAPGATATVDFVNTQHGRVIVTKYHDENGNSNWDEGEEVLPGWTMGLEDENEGTTQEETDENGEALFEDMLPGIYTLSEELQPGWEQT
jgi:hypothetical protein